MASFTLIGSASIVQVLSPTVAADMVAATIRTEPTGIIATTLVSQSDFATGAAGATLQAFADGIETIIAQGEAVGGSGTSSLDASGLQQYFVTFEVSYDPPGAPAGAVTADVDVPVSLLDSGGTTSDPGKLAQAQAMIDATYNNLVSLSGGTPAVGTPPPPSQSPPPPPRTEG